MKQQKAASKRAIKSTMAAPKCATEKKFRHLCSTESIDEILFKEQKTVEQQTVELTTFRPEASSVTRNERYYEKVHELLKKKSDSEV